MLHFDHRRKVDNLVELDEKLAIGSLKKIANYRGLGIFKEYRALIKDIYYN